MSNLPTEEGSVIGWAFWYDGPNYMTAVLSYNIRWDYGPDGEADPLYPEFEGLMWHTSWGAVLTPEEMEHELSERYPIHCKKWVSLGRIPYNRK